eukprot:COSAG01_NODE_6598_length_3587_cov_3.169725_7_plen_77_part_00
MSGSGATVRDIYRHKELAAGQRGTVRFPKVRPHDSVFVRLTPAGVGARQAAETVRANLRRLVESLRPLPHSVGPSS